MCNDLHSSNITYHFSSVPIFTYINGEYTHVTDIDKQFYDQILTKYIRLGSVDQISTREFIKTRLSECQGRPQTNTDAFHNYLVQGKFVVDSQLFTNSENFFLQCIHENRFISLSQFITHSFPETIPINSELKHVWEATPESPKHGVSGEGELFFAFFCNGVKPLKGDLHIGQINIELKGRGGRLFKGRKVDDEKTQKILDNISYGDTFLWDISRFIASAAGVSEVEGIENEIHDLICQYKNLQVLICKSFDAYKTGKNIFHPNNIFLKIGGIAQLLCYKRREQFDVMLCYNNLENDTMLQFINLNNVDCLIKLYSLLQSLQSKVNINRNKDGKGFMIKLCQ